MLKSGIDLIFTVAMVTKNGCQNRLKMEKLPFWSKFKTFDREINIEHKQIPKIYFKFILTDDENYHSTQYIERFVGIRLC